MNDFNKIDIFPWNKSLETGIKVIDEQHKVLVNLINKIASDVAYGTTQKMFEKSVGEVVKYTQYHFQTEENIWKKYFPPNSTLKSHILAHSRLVGTVTELIKTFETQSLEENIEALLSLLTHWLTHHILDGDMRMSFTIEAIEAGHSLENAQEMSNKKMTGVMSTILETSLFLYDNLCASTLAYNRAINQRRNLENKLQNEIQTHENLKQNLSVAEHHSRSEFPKEHIINQFSNTITENFDSKGNKASVFICIDGFVDLIETEGEETGDTLLKVVANSIQSCLSPSDILVRVSYCNFVIFYNDLQDKQQLDQNVSEIMIIISEPIPFDNNLIQVYAKMDMTFYPEGSSIRDELLMTSNDAIYGSLLNKNNFSLSDNKEQEETEVKIKSLTPREKDVLDLVVIGTTNKSIAAGLDISIKTVELHRSRVMKKMDVCTLAELVKVTMIMH